LPEAAKRLPTVCPRTNIGTACWVRPVAAAPTSSQNRQHAFFVLF
jgi:hypothetical protein